MKAKRRTAPRTRLRLVPDAVSFYREGDEIVFDFKGVEIVGEVKSVEIADGEPKTIAVTHFNVYASRVKRVVR